MQFLQSNALIPTSRRRVISLWFGNVDRINLIQTDEFTGSVVLVTCFTVEGYYQYFLCFYSLTHQITEIWKTSPDDIAITEAPLFEKEIFDRLSQMGIEIIPISEENTEFSSILMNLPMAYNDENETAPAAKFPNSSQGSTSCTISEIEKKLFQELFVQL